MYRRPLNILPPAHIDAMSNYRYRGRPSHTSSVHAGSRQHHDPFMSSLRILADENIPHAGVAFGAVGSVRTMPGQSISRSDLADVDVLLVRSVTSVDADVLDGRHVDHEPAGQRDLAPAFPEIAADTGFGDVGKGQGEKEHLQHTGHVFPRQTAAFLFTLPGKGMAEVG